MEFRGHGHHLHKLTKYALEFRSLDGTQHNLIQPDLNSAGTECAPVGPANFADGCLSPRADGPFRALTFNLQFSNPAQR
jgi:hypothetical protein